MPRTAEPRYTEAEIDAMYGPRLDRLAEQIRELRDELREVAELIDRQKSEAEGADN
jgi:hypothetical protein